MQFVNPYFLFAFSALAIPIIVHLFNFRRYKKVYFSNTAFLNELVEETNNAQKLKRLLILLARCLVIIFLVLAFAQPFIPKNENVKKGKTAVSIFVDNSFSMQSTSSDRSLIEKAKVLATDIVQSYDNDVSFQLITQSLEGKQQRLLSKDDCIEQIKNIQICPSSHSLEEINKRQVDALRIENFDVKKIYIVSDFQKNIGSIESDSSFDINLVKIDAQAQKNIFIDTAWLENPLSIVGQNNKLLVKIKNESTESIENLRISMTVNGQQKAISDLSIEANSYQLDTLEFNQNTKEWNNVKISLDDFPIEFDNNYYVSFYVNDAIHLLNLDAGTQNKYIKALSNFNSYFKTEQSNIAQIDYSKFSTQQLIILSNLKDISSGLNTELKKYLDNGGNIALFPAKDANINSINTFLQSIQAITFNGNTEIVKEVKTINTDASLLNDIFENKNQKNISLPKTNFSFNSNNNLGNAQKILVFGDGQSCMTQYQVGKGHAYIFSVPLDASICDLPMHAIFAPLIFKMAIDGQNFNDIQYTIGTKKSIQIANYSTKNDENVLYVKGNKLEFIPEQSMVNNQLNIYTKDQIQNAGHYDIFSKSTNDKIGTFAMNYNRSESHMDFLSLNELEAMYTGKNITIYNGNSGNISHAVKENDQGISLWKVCIIFALLFLLAEILLIRFWKTSSN
jgi:hypothetical protein